MTAARASVIAFGALLTMAALPTNSDSPSQWQAWMATNHLLLDTQAKAIDFAEAVVRAAYGARQVTQERPFVAEDLGDRWRVHGEGKGSDAIPFFAVSSTVTLAKRTGAILDYRLTRQGPLSTVEGKGRP